MKNDDWFRGAGWTREAQDVFNAKIARVRGDTRRQQYARIKALALIESGDAGKIHAAIELLRKSLHEWPPEYTFETDATYAALGDAHAAVKEYDAASQAYERSLTWDMRSTHTGYWRYPLMIITAKLAAQYDKALSIVEKYAAARPLVFETEKFIYHAVRAVAFQHRGEAAMAHAEAANALACAQASRSKFAHHPKTGLVDATKYASLIARLETT